MNPEKIEPGWIAPGNRYKLASPPEMGWLPIGETALAPVVDLAYIRSLKSMPENPYHDDGPTGLAA